LPEKNFEVWRQREISDHFQMKKILERHFKGNKS
jgi:hypothetical protein